MLSTVEIAGSGQSRPLVMATAAVPGAHDDR